MIKVVADAKTGERVEIPTPKENYSALFPESFIPEDQIPTPPSAEPVLDSEPVNPTRAEAWWTEKNPGKTVRGIAMGGKMR